MLALLVSAVRGFIQEEDGPTAVEYAVMLALIIVVCLTAITYIGQQANNTFLVVGSSMATSS
jgi:pilus assembly protein Flp/PilA